MSTFGKKEELLEILQHGGAHTSKSLCEELGIEDRLEVCRLVRLIRKDHINKGKSPYIYTTKHGYSLETNASDVIYEANMRLRIGIGTLLNGAPIFMKAKKIASAQLGKLKVQYKPDMLKIGNFI